MGLSLRQELSVECAICHMTITEEKVQQGMLLLKVGVADGYINVNVCPNCGQEVHDNCKHIEDIPEDWIDEVANFYMRSVKTDEPELWLAAKETIKKKFAITIY